MARKLLFLIPAGLFAVLLAAFAIGLRHDPRLVPSALIDRTATDFSLPGLYQDTGGLSRKDLEGGVTLPIEPDDADCNFPLRVAVGTAGAPARARRVVVTR